MSADIKVDDRILGVMRCSVCALLPKSAIFQCSKGHLLCAPCFANLFLEENYRTQSHCPQCKVAISRTHAIRNIAVEQAICEIPVPCCFCTEMVARKHLEEHENLLCDRRLTDCRFRMIGCTWRGPYSDVPLHEAVCQWPQKPAAEVLEFLQIADQRELENQTQQRHILDMLSSEAVAVVDLQLKPVKDSSNIESFETSVFSAFSNQWQVRARSSTENTAPQLLYQLLLKTKQITPCVVSYCSLQGSLGTVKLNAIVNKVQFTHEHIQSPELAFSVASQHSDPIDPHYFSFRLLMSFMARSEQQ